MSDIISQAKLFLDFGAGSGGAAAGARLLRRVKSVKQKDDRGVEVVLAVGVTGGAGFRRKQGGGTLTFEVYREVTPEVDYRQLKADARVFTFTIQDENNGGREKFLNCTVSNVDRSVDADGNHMDNVEVKYLLTDMS